MSEVLCPVCWRSDGKHNEDIHKQQEVLDRLPPVTKVPCVECPWRKDSVPGHLGPHSAEEWNEIAHGESPIACHMTIENDGQDWSELRQCAGSAQFRTNICKTPRHPNVAVASERSKTLIFGSSKEFLDHHQEA